MFGYQPKNKILSFRIYYITVYASTIGITGVMGERIYSGYSITEAQRLYIRRCVEHDR